MKRKYLKLSALILSVSALTVLSSCETSARYIGSNTWEGTVTQTYHDPNEWYGLSNSDLNSSTWWNTTNGLNGQTKTKLYLTEDIHLTSDCYAFWQNGGTDITLCLNGHNIYGYEYKSDSTDGGAITIGKDGSSNPSTLRIEDCVGGGKITSCKADVGGAIKVNEGGNLYFNGGTIEGNEVVYEGGAIYNYKGYVEINGGTIKNNTAGQEGGGIYNDQGKLVINGGEISGNSALDGGGVYSDCDSTDTNQGLYINGGTITGNKAETDAGGVKFEHYVASEQNEEVYEETESTLHLSGDPYIYDNYATQNDDSIQYNVETDELSLLAFDGALTEGALIGVTYSGKKAEKDPPYQISVAETSTSYTQNSAQYIISDVEYYETKYNDTGRYLTLDGVTGYNEVATSSITLTFDFVHSGDTTPLDSTSSSGKLILPTDADGNDYARIFIEGSWDNYQTEYNLTLDQDTGSYYVTLTGLTINYHSFYIYVGYLDNDDHIPLSDDNPEFTFMVPLEVDSLADSEGIYTIEFNVESENEFSELVSEEGNVKKVTARLVFRMYSYASLIDPQTLDYGDFYIYSDLDGWSDWQKCVVEDGYYVLYLDNVESKQYEWSGVLYYNNEEIPEPTDTDIWNYKVNYTDDPGANCYFTPVDSYVDEEGIATMYVDFDVKEMLYNILPESGYIISRAGESFTLSLDLTYGGYSVTCPDFGKFYIIGGWHVTDGAWDEWDLLTYNDTTGLYETTFATDDVIYAATYSYDIVFVHNNQSYDYWTNKLTSTDRTMTLSWTESETLSHTDSCYLDVDVSQFHTLVTGESDTMTIYFNLQNDDGSIYDVGYGYNLYIAGSWDSDSWGFYLCEYDGTYSAGNQVFYRAVLPITAAGGYSFDIVRPTTAGAEPASDWSNIDKIITNNGYDALMYIDSTEFSYGYSIETFYTNGYGNYQES